MLNAVWPLKAVARPRASSAIRTQQIRLRPSSQTNLPEHRPAPQHAATPVSLTWPYKGWDEQIIHGVMPGHHKPRTISDHFAWRVTQICRQVIVPFHLTASRWAMDLATGMGPEQHVDGCHSTTGSVTPSSLTES